MVIVAALATIERTGTIIEALKAEVKTPAPQISHITIEVEGIATLPDVEESLAQLEP